MKKKGFTLIELIAVIVVLGIVLLIAVPLVSNLIGNSQKTAYKETAMGVIRAFENEVAGNKYEKLPVIYEVNGNKISKLNSTVENEIEYDGKLQSKGHIYMNGHESTAIFIQNDKYCAIKEFVDKEAKIYKKDSEECKLGVQSSSKWYLEATDHEVEINSYFRIPTPVAKDNEGADLKVTWAITNITQNKVIGENIWVIEPEHTTKLNDVFEVYYKAFDESINEERSTTATIRVVDTIKPSVSAEIYSTTSNYNSDKIKINIEAEDNGTNVSNLKMYYGITEIDASSDKWVTYNASNSYTLPSGMNGSTYDIIVQIMDEAGNIETVSTPYTVYAECKNNTTYDYGGWGSCSRSCGRGTQRRTVYIEDSLTGKTCSTSSSSRSCNTHSCPTTTKEDLSNLAAGEAETTIEAKLP